jgi:glutathione S-transferase
MITLHGFPVSNYYNKVKLALLEKNLPFTEAAAHPLKMTPADVAASPLGKVPFISTAHGVLSESQAILNYLELAYPQPPLLPADPFAAAKVHELITYIDLHVELVARELYGQAFFGGTISESAQARVRKQLEKNIAALKSLLKFAPYAAGETFTQADCAAFASLPLVGMATKAIYAEDLLLSGGVDYKAYIKMIGERPSGQKVLSDRRAALTKAS